MELADRDKSGTLVIFFLKIHYFNIFYKKY